MLDRLLTVNPHLRLVRPERAGVAAPTASDTLCPLSHAPQQEIPQQYQYWSRENGQLYDSRWLRQHLHGDADRRSPLTRRPMHADVSALWPERRHVQMQRSVSRWLDAHDSTLHVALVCGGTAAITSAFICMVLAALYEIDPQRGRSAVKRLYFAPLIPLGTMGLLCAGVAATSGLALGLRRILAPAREPSLELGPAEAMLFAPPPSPALNDS